ncbi:hypothetical protein GT354_33155, partial [Streptomyces sp. SID3343]|nr:hypothetical protein [Streptomyces sp. SID3343]
ARPGPALSGITTREREVLSLAGRGLTNTEIAAEPHLGPATAKTHVGRLPTKLGTHDRVQLVIAAYEAGLVAPPADPAPSRLRSARGPRPPHARTITTPGSSGTEQAATRIHRNRGVVRACPGGGPALVRGKWGGGKTDRIRMDRCVLPVTVPGRWAPLFISPSAARIGYSLGHLMW